VDDIIRNAGSCALDVRIVRRVARGGTGQRLIQWPDLLVAVAGFRIPGHGPLLRRDRHIRAWCHYRRRALWLVSRLPREVGLAPPRARGAEVERPHEAHLARTGIVERLGAALFLPCRESRMVGGDGMRSRPGFFASIGEPGPPDLRRPFSFSKTWTGRASSTIERAKYDPPVSGTC
jgi:hypothetical protein